VNIVSDTDEFNPLRIDPILKMPGGLRLLLQVLPGSMPMKPV